MNGFMICSGPATPAAALVAAAVLAYTRHTGHAPGVVEVAPGAAEAGQASAPVGVRVVAGCVPRGHALAGLEG